MRIPVIANGNISSYNDIERCLEYTKADAVMSAECLLWNPGLFSENEYLESGPNRPPVLKYAAEYIDLAEKYPQVGPESSAFIPDSISRAFQRVMVEF